MTSNLKLISCLLFMALLVGCKREEKVKVQYPAWTNSLGMKFVKIPAGTFAMGDEREVLGATPVHNVTLSEFWIGQYEVTNAEFEKFKKRPRPIESLSDNQPVTRITWQEAVNFCKWLSKKEKRVYRLPTEAEWEYAARGGLQGKDYPWGNQSPDRRATWGRMTTTPVGTYDPNNYGLHDAAGNVEEWVSDWYDEHYYSISPKDNPKGPVKGDGEKITRGGYYAILELSVALRRPYPPHLFPSMSKLNDPSQGDGSGFRVVLESKAINSTSNKLNRKPTQR